MKVHGSLPWSTRLAYRALSAATLLEEMASTLQRMAVIQVTGEGDTLT